MRLTGVPSTDYPELAAEHPVAHDYAKGKTHNAVSIPTGTTSSVDLVTAGFTRLVVLARMTAALVGDMTLVVLPYEDDGTTQFAEAVPTLLTQADAITGGVDRQINVYDLAGIDKVSVQMKNTNAGSETATVVYYLQR